MYLYMYALINEEIFLAMLCLVFVSLFSLFFLFLLFCMHMGVVFVLGCYVRCIIWTLVV